MAYSKFGFLIPALCAAMLTACSTGLPIPGAEAPAEESVAEEPAQPEAEATVAVVEGSDTQPTPTEEAAPPAAEQPAEADSADDLFPGAGPWAVPVNTADGVTLSATVYGSGDQALILAPMYTGEQSGWAPFALTAADTGYRVITFDFRGFGQSGGDIDLTQSQTDLTAIIDFARGNGFEVSALVGAGEGGTAALLYTIENGSIPRLAILSSSYEYVDISVSPEALSSISVPTLWIASRQDMQHDISDMFEQVGGESKEIWIYEESSLHGTYILESLNANDLQQRILDFLAAT